MGRTIELCLTSQLEALLDQNTRESSPPLLAPSTAPHRWEGGHSSFLPPLGHQHSRLSYISIATPKYDSQNPGQELSFAGKIKKVWLFCLNRGQEPGRPEPGSNLKRGASNLGGKAEDKDPSGRTSLRARAPAFTNQRLSAATFTAGNM